MDTRAIFNVVEKIAESNKDLAVKALEVLDQQDVAMALNAIAEKGNLVGGTALARQAVVERIETG